MSSRFNPTIKTIREKRMVMRHAPPRKGVADGWYPAFAVAEDGDLRVLLALFKGGKGLLLDMDEAETRQMIECLEMGLRRDQGKDVVVQ